MMPLPIGCKLACFDEDVLKELWVKIKGFDNIFSDEDMRNPESFLKLFLAPDAVTIWVEDGGFVLLKHVQRGFKAEFHACFWDKRLSPRTELLRNLMAWVFMEFNLVRLESYVVTYAKAVRRFLITRLGFKPEATLRAAWLHKGIPQDLEVMSILRDEVFI